MLSDKQKVEVSRDIWTALFEDTKQRLIASGLYSDEEADEQAAKEVRNAIGASL